MFLGSLALRATYCLLALAPLARALERPQACDKPDCRAGGCRFTGCGLDGAAPPTCRGGGCVFDGCESASCDGGGCTFVSSARSTCKGGGCEFSAHRDLLLVGFCDGGGCTYEGQPIASDIGADGSGAVH